MKILKASQVKPEILKDKARKELAQTMDKVAPIIDRVKRDGDKALIFYTKKFDNVQIKKAEIRVSDEELKKAYRSIRKEELEAIRFAIENVRAFHEAQKPQTLSFEKISGVKLTQVFRPLERVGAYIPGGRAIYPSSVVMTVVPAKVAGVKSVIVCSPPSQDGSINAAVLVAAAEAGAEALFKVGGAQAVAAMAYGTETVPKVDKIVGPGNIYVTAAKAMVSRDVAIDFLAGPSEILILADESADSRIVASDLLAQSEHDPQASAVLVTTSENLARKVAKLVQGQLGTYPRKEIMERVIRENLWIITAVSLEEALELANNLAPEHLEVVVKEPGDLLEKVENAGAIFLGAYSPVAVGDYVAGSNHVLPTGGMAKSFSGLSLRDFIKSIDVINCSKDGLERLRVAAETLATMEGLEAHRRSVEERFRK